MTNPNNTRTNRIAADQAMIAGTQKFLNLKTLPVGATNMSPTDIVNVFQKRVSAGQAVVTADAARTAAVKNDRDERTETAAFVQAYRRIILGMFQEAPDTLAVFGMTAPKARKTKVATKAAAVAKNKATRAARGTVGSKKKLAIKGTVPADNGAAPVPATPATPALPATGTADAPATAATPPAPVTPAAPATPAKPSA